MKPPNDASVAAAHSICLSASNGARSLSIVFLSFALSKNFSESAAAALALVCPEPRLILKLQRFKGKKERGEKRDIKIFHSAAEDSRLLFCVFIVVQSAN
jgi:hypothetical protein